MDKEAPQEARLRPVSLGPPRLATLSASSAASPPTSPHSRAAPRSQHAAAPLPSGSGGSAGMKVEAWQLAAAANDGDGGAGAGATSQGAGAWGLSGEAAAPQLSNGKGPPAGESPHSDGGSLLQLLRATPPPREDGGAGGSPAGVPAKGAAATVAKLRALSPSAAAAPAPAGAAAANGRDVGGAPAKRPGSGGLLGLFRSGKPSADREAQQAQQQQQGPPLQPEPSGGSSASSAGSSKEKKKKKEKKRGSWFGGGSKPASKSQPASGERRDGARGAAGVLLPGLPLTEAGGPHGGSTHSMASSSAGYGSSAGEEGGSAAATPPGASPAVQACGMLGAALPAAAALSPQTDASDLSAPSSVAGSSQRGPSPLSPPPLGPLLAEGDGGKKGHRRHRSLTSMLLHPGGWRKRSHSHNASGGSDSDFGVGDGTPTLPGSLGVSRTGSPAPSRAEALAAVAAAGEALAVPPPIAEEPAAPLLPPGTTGIRNIGNTCFINAAIQCLRYTPGLPLAVAPDLLEEAERRRQSGGGGAAAASVPATPSAPAALQAAAPAAEDVHQQALARVSMDPLALRKPFQDGGGAAAAGEAAAAPAGAAADVAVGAERAAAASGSAAGAPEAAAEPAAAGAASATGGAPPTDAGREQQAGGSGEAAAAAAPAEAAAAPAAPAAPAARKPQRPPKGALLEAFASLVKDLYLPPQPGGSAHVCAAPMLQTLRAFPVAAEYFDGGQHDCQEVLHELMNLLHDDLNRVQRPAPGQQPAAAPAEGEAEPAQGEGCADEGAAAELRQDAEEPAATDVQPPSEQQQQQQQPSEASEASTEGVQPAAEQQQAQQQAEQQAEPPAEEDEAAKADRIWQQQLARDDSIIQDLFGGQTQSSVTCHKCGSRFTTYEPFWNLSLPLAKETKGGFSWLGLRGSPSSIQDCLTAFTADEKLEGAEAFHCERCGDRTPATKHLRIHRFPEVLVLHIKRFKYKGASTDKLTANVSFPLAGLQLHQFASPECEAGPAECSYQLFAVSNHYGNLSGGHYTAMCRVPQPGEGEDAWYSFNDEQVTRVSPSQVVSQYAYILFYVRSQASSVAAAAAEAVRGHHRRTSSAASAGKGSAGGGA